MFGTSKLHWKKSMWKQRGFFDQKNYTEKSTWTQSKFFWPSKYIKKVLENYMDFSTRHRKKYVETTSIIWPSKLHQKKYVETTTVFWPSKLHRKKCVETMQIIRPAKLRLKSTWKWRGNSSKFDSTWSAHWEVSSVMQ